MRVPRKRRDLAALWRIGIVQVGECSVVSLVGDAMNSLRHVFVSWPHSRLYTFSVVQ